MIVPCCSGLRMKIVQLLADGPEMSIATDGGKNLEMFCRESKHVNNSIQERLVVSHLVKEVPT